MRDRREASDAEGEPRCDDPEQARQPQTEHEETGDERAADPSEWPGLERGRQRESGGPDSRDLAEIVDRAEAAVLGTPGDDARGERGPDPVEPVELLDGRGVQ